MTLSELYTMKFVPCKGRRAIYQEVSQVTVEDRLLCSTDVIVEDYHFTMRESKWKAIVYILVAFH